MRHLLIIIEFWTIVVIQIRVRTVYMVIAVILLDFVVIVVICIW